MERKNAQRQTQANQENIPNTPSTIHRASDEDTKCASINSNKEIVLVMTDDYQN